jgi:uncharacterized membrane protein YdjX (TVP38/TMEM64 family)
LDSAVDQTDILVKDERPELVNKSTAVAANGKLIGSLAAVSGVFLLILGGIVFKDAIGAFLTHFTSIVDDLGPMGVLLYALVYTGLEVLAVPAIPLTMTAGAIFGIVPGSLVVSLAGTVAATISFLVARYAARDKVRFRPL